MNARIAQEITYCCLYSKKCSYEKVNELLNLHALISYI